MSKLVSISLSTILVIVWSVLAIIGLRRNRNDKDWYDQDGK